MKAEVQKLGAWAKEHMKGLIVVAAVTLVIYVLLLLNILPQYNETKVTEAGEKVFPLIVAIIVVVYAFLDIRSDEYKEKHE